MPSPATLNVGGAGGFGPAGVQFFPAPSGQSVKESIGANTGMASALKGGTETLSAQQTVTFVPYVRCVLPLDGYVFWVRAEMLSASALLNVATYNSFAFNQPQVVMSSLPPLVAKGSLHIATTNQQSQDESFSVNRVVFTSEVEIQDLNEVSPMLMYLATIGDFRFAFSQRRSFYKQADLFHYEGEAVYPVMEQQIVDSSRGFDARDIIVSNSLPMWLTLNKYCPVFPSFLVPDNIRPPYAAIHIEETRALQAFPVIDAEHNHWQLVSDRVKVTLYGMRNFNALSWQDYVFNYSRYYGTLGMMNMPVVRDEKRGQVELSILAQKKSIDFEVSYYQVVARDVARQLIKTAIPRFFVGGGVEPVEIVLGGPGQLDYTQPSQSGLFSVVN